MQAAIEASRCDVDDDHSSCNYFTNHKLHHDHDCDHVFNAFRGLHIVLVLLRSSAAELLDWKPLPWEGDGDGGGDDNAGNEAPKSSMFGLEEDVPWSRLKKVSRW